jgi:hypothetical protein
MRVSPYLITLSVAAGVIATAPMAVADVIIDSPNPQTAITGGQRLTVQGSGCPVSSSPAVSLNDKPLPTDGVVQPDGRWEARVEVPVVGVDDAIPEAREFSLAASCGSLRGATVVVYRDPLPNTGRTAIPVLPCGVALVIAGAALRRLVRVGR